MKIPMRATIFLSAALASAPFTGVVRAADLERGRALHDTFCIACHSPEVYVRPDRLANSYLEIRQQVERWQGNARLGWTPYDVQSVTDYLAEKYYKIPY